MWIERVRFRWLECSRLTAKEAREHAPHELGHLLAAAAWGYRNAMLGLIQKKDGSVAFVRLGFRPDSPDTPEGLFPFLVVALAGHVFQRQGFLRKQDLKSFHDNKILLTVVKDLAQATSFLRIAALNGWLPPQPANMLHARDIALVRNLKPKREEDLIDSKRACQGFLQLVSKTLEHPPLALASQTAERLFEAIPPEAFQAMVDEAVARRVISPEQMPAFLDRHLTPEVQQRLTGIMDAYVTDAMRRFMPVKPEQPPPQ
ncbi:MAG: hypothetical protein IPK79_12615 [Vampirovibrionales bacterium]|nr:hypothetical protein [Vampirovibrionales bacterium]